MKTIIKIYREIEVPKKYEHFFKSDLCPKWDEVKLDWDNYSTFCDEITKTLNPTDEWKFLDY